MSQTHYADNIPRTCGHCGSYGIHVHSHVQWANGKGAGVRVFCRHCGWATDKRLYADGRRTIRNMDWTKRSPIWYFMKESKGTQ